MSSSAVASLSWLREKKLAKIAVYSDSFQANIVRTKLEANGIPATVFGEELMMIMPNAGLPRFEVMVLESDAEAAKEILALENDNLEG